MSSPYDELAKLLAKEGVTSDASELDEIYTDTGIPHLNFVLSGSPFGGIAKGRMVEIAGESMSGKTMLLSQLFIATQKQGGYAGIWDHERSYNEHLSVKQGLDTHPGKWVKRKGVAFETSVVEAYQQGKKIRESGVIGTAPILLGFDSFAAMIPLSQLESKGQTGKITEKEMDAYTMNDTSALARVASTVLKVFKAKISDYGITAVFLNQLAANMDISGPTGGATTKSKGGKSLPFYADIRLFIGGKEIKDKSKLTAKEMTITVKKNKITMPGDKIKINFIFDRVARTGYFDVLPSYVNFLKEEGVIEMNGAWINWGGEKFQGIQKVVDHYAARPNGLEELKTLHQEFIDSKVK